MSLVNEDVAGARVVAMDGKLITVKPFVLSCEILEVDKGMLEKRRRDVLRVKATWHLEIRIITSFACV